jgi:AbrB family looped-hinge helix DNA binding protein
VARSETTIDRFGRVLIPKELRQQLGLAAGTRVRLQSRREGLLLVREDEETPLREINGLLVYTGKVTGDPDRVLEGIRSDRLRHLTSPEE